MTYTCCCVYNTSTPDDGQKTCPKHVEFYSKNKFEKLVHLIGFITRIYYNARSSECQNCTLYVGLSAPFQEGEQRIVFMCFQEWPVLFLKICIIWSCSMMHYFIKL